MKRLFLIVGLLAAVRAHAAVLEERCSARADISGLPPHRIAARGLVHVPAGHSVFPELTVAEIKTDVVALYEKLRAATEAEKTRRGVRMVDYETRA